ncbi:Kunitz-type protease inhibitor 4 [Microtus ochrogaster]|uniref:Kunitz-type protease inhibitor 4 n=1 Tax=Microtus ochrogaster TaxID=79684 RepID=A0A8J6KSM9_MICOH|nr:Kunitz-type protease inhibitor 4 [Microtus ochrogaster]
MKPAKMGFLLGIFIFCSVTAPVLSGVARLTHNICREYKESCNMDMDPGSCYEVHFRYFYNRTAGECQSFVFTGCNGNLNNYRLKIECDIECNEEYRTVRYYFNKVTSLCEPFVFSGCGGNRNNFKSKYLCEFYCIDKQTQATQASPHLVEEEIWLTGPTLQSRPYLEENHLTASEGPGADSLSCSR